MKKVCIICLLVLTCLIVGCGHDKNIENNNQKEVSTAFAKEEINIPDEIISIQSMVACKDGSVLVVAAENNYHEGSIWKIDSEGKNWEFQYRFTDYLPEKITNDLENYEIIGTIDCDGVVYCKVYDISNLSTESEGSNKLSQVIYRIAGKDCTEFDISVPEDGNIYGMKFSEYGDLLTDDGMQIFSVDKNSGNIFYALRERDYSDEPWWSYYETENTVYVLTDSGIVAYDRNSGVQLQENDQLEEFNIQYKKLVESYGYSENDLMNNNYLNNQDIIVDDSGDSIKIVFANINGVYLYEDGSLTLGINAEGTLNNDGTDLNTLTMINNEIWLSFSDGKAHLIKYVYDKSINKIDTQLTLYTLQDNSEIQKVISAYENAHPNVEITVECGMDGESGITTSDAIKLLNTNILAGDGPDLILLDGLSVDDYIEKNMLMNLDDILESVNQSSEMFESILKTYQTEDGVFAVPSKFALMFVGGKEDLSTINVEDIQKIYGYESTLKFKSDLYGRMATILYRSYMARNESGDYTIEQIEQFLENLQILDTQCDAQFTESTGMQTYQLLTNINLQLEDMGDTFRMYAGADRMLGYILNTDDLQVIYGKSDSDQTIQTKLLTQNGESLYVPMSVMGISATSNKQEASAEFLAYYLSEEGQKNDSSIGLSVNRDCLISQLEAMDDLEMSLAENNNNINLKIEKFDDTQIQTILDILDQVSVASTNDETVFEILMEQAVNYLSNSSNLQTAANDAYQKINLYLAE